MSAQEVIYVERSNYLSTVGDLRDRGYDMCADVAGVDYLEHLNRQLPEGIQGERFEIVANLVSIEARSRVRIRVQVPENDPVLDSLFHLYPGSEAMEREIYDLFGIIFTDHPDLTRILLPEDWEGYPLRKDYAVGAVPVQFKAVNGAE